MGKKTWMGEITEEGKSETEIYFTDVGIKMPLGLTSWSHTHLLIKKEWGTQIEDRLFFNGLNRLHTWILLPALWIQFIYRKPLYERVIRKRLSDSNIK
jgi:ligand-binding SRPBCC domain-containing protein